MQQTPDFSHASTASMECHLSDADYKTLCDLIYQKSRIALGDRKKELVHARLDKRLRARHVQNYSDYIALLKSPDEADEMAHFVDAICTNYTFFFRENAHFEFLKHQAIPQILKNPLKKNDSHVRIWSNACSSGEEPLSIAITLAENLPSQNKWQWSLIASDISQKIIDKAQKCIFQSERTKEIPENLVKKYFEIGTGDWEGFVRARDVLRDHIQFMVLNLFSNHSFNHPFDVIFCRNVMIYFNHATQQELIDRLTEKLIPGGYLIISHTEGLVGIRHSLKSVQPSIYQKIHA